MEICHLPEHFVLDIRQELAKTGEKQMCCSQKSFFLSDIYLTLEKQKLLRL